MPNYILTPPNGEPCPLPFWHEEITQHPLVRDCGYTYVETSDPQPDPAAKLAADKAFGQSIVDSFLAASKAANLGLYETEILDGMLDKAERYLLRGSIGVAKEALELVEPNQLFPSQAKAYYLQLLTNHLNDQ